MSMKKKINFIVDENNSTDDIILEALKSEFGDDFSKDVNFVVGNGLKITKDEIVDDICNIIFADIFSGYFAYNDIEIDGENDYVSDTKSYNITECSKKEDGTIVDINMDNTVMLLNMPKLYIELYVNNATFLGKDILKDKLPTETVYMDNDVAFAAVLPSVDAVYNAKINMMFGEGFNKDHRALIYLKEADGEQYAEFIYDGIKYKASKSDDGEKYYKFIDGEYVLLDDKSNIESDIDIGIDFDIEAFIVYIDESNIEDSKVPYGFINDDGIFEVISNVDPENIKTVQISVNGIETDESKFKESEKVTVLKEVAGSLRPEDIEKIYADVDDKIAIKAEETAQEISELANNADFIAQISQNVLEKINVSLIAKNGDEIVTSLTYDADKNAYVLDYDTSLLDGTDYTIEMKIS